MPGRRLLRAREGAGEQVAEEWRWDEPELDARGGCTQTLTACA